jgi:hypothetical protein
VKDEKVFSVGVVGLDMFGSLITGIYNFQYVGVWRSKKQNDGQGGRFICCRYGDIVWRLASCPTSEEQYSVAACLLLQRLTNNSNTAMYLSDYLRPQTEIHSFILKCDKRA